MFLKINDSFNFSSWASFSIQELMDFISVKSIETQMYRINLISLCGNKAQTENEAQGEKTEESQNLGKIISNMLKRVTIYRKIKTDAYVTTHLPQRDLSP